jgi:hypothetical protein
MADLYLKALESERKALWATCRLKGLPRDTPERERIAQIDADIAAHKAKQAGAKKGGTDTASKGKASKDKGGAS